MKLTDTTDSITTQNTSSSLGTSENPFLDSNTKFSLKLFREIANQDSGENIAISPLSISLALSMLLNGADGETFDQISKVLDFSELSLSQINYSSEELMMKLSSDDENAKVLIANSIWKNLGFQTRPKFLETAQKYSADIVELDFSKPQSLTRINRWSSDKTQGKISKIIDKLSPNDVIFLLNAIYFKGQWKSKFDPQKTSSKTFYLINGETIQHPLMSNSGQYAYYENQDFQAVSLPYGEGHLSMDVFLPTKQVSLNKFVENLTADNFNEWVSKFRLKEGSLLFPRFTQGYEVSLNTVLQQLGLTSAFDSSKANFSRLSNQSVSIDEFKHKAVIEVNEEGTEAAAVTSIGIAITSVDIPFRMVVDRPFFFAIRDNRTGSILFMGSILDPAQ